MSEQIAKLNIEEKLIACIELAQKRQADIQALRAENTRLRKEYTKLFGLAEPIAKMLTELKIIPIGCSREQELAWKMAVKNFRHYQRDFESDVLLQAALQPERGTK